MSSKTACPRRRGGHARASGREAPVEGSGSGAAARHVVVSVQKASALRARVVSRHGGARCARATQKRSLRRCSPCMRGDSTSHAPLAGNGACSRVARVRKQSTLARARVARGMRGSWHARLRAPLAPVARVRRGRRRDARRSASPRGARSSNLELWCSRGGDRGSARHGAGMRVARSRVARALGTRTSLDVGAGVAPVTLGRNRAGRKAYCQTRAVKLPTVARSGVLSREDLQSAKAGNKISF